MTPQYHEPVTAPRHRKPTTTMQHSEPVAHHPTPLGHATCEPKIKEPEMFSGHDPLKLYGFLVHCKMAFQSQPLQFTLESVHIIWAGLYLTNTVQQWFQCLIMESEESPILSNWTLFEEDLHTYFGDPNEVMTQE